MEEQKNRPEEWDTESEQLQWVASWDLDGPEEDSAATIYVRKDRAPAPVKIWNGTGKEQEEEEERYDDGVIFLFSQILRARNFVEGGKLDDESKAMLKKRFNVDVNADG